MAHTPGPWLVAERPWMVVSAAGSKLHVVADCLGSMKMKKAEAEANALLIAAAPDLLKALVDCKQAVRSSAGFEEKENAVRAATVALTKAITGDTPR